MAEPKGHVFCGDKVCVITLEGAITTPEILQILQRHYPLIAGLNLLWNMAKADLHAVADEHFADIAAMAALNLPPSRTRKTAYVVAEQPTFVRVSNYLNKAFEARVPSEYAVFLEVESAQRWLARD